MTEGNITKEERVLVECPKCGREYEDFDGFGVVFCESCGFCRHISCHNSKCDFCGEKVDP